MLNRDKILQYYDKNKKRKSLQSVDLDKLKKKSLQKD